MKTISLAIFLMLCFSCGVKNSTAEQKEEVSDKNIFKPEFQSILDIAEVDGALLIFNLKEDLFYSNDFEWSNRGFLPASTFKIANSIIGLETGVIDDESVFLWDGEEKWLKNWEQDLALKEAFQYSCVHCYQEVARKIGAERMKDYIQKLDYGNLDIDSTNIDMFWLVGESRISQVQQIDFLKRFFTHKLPISDSTEKIVRNLMLFEETEQYKFSGKSGLSNENGEYNGWFVGYIELKDNTYFFATNLNPKEEFDVDSFIEKRLSVTVQALKELGVIE